MQTIQIFRLAAVVVASSALGRHTRAKRALWALLGAIKRAERAAWAAALERERQGQRSAAYRRGLALAADANQERGAVSLPLLTFQACAAVGLASALWAVYLRLVAQIGGMGL